MIHLSGLEEAIRNEIHAAAPPEMRCVCFDWDDELEIESFYSRIVPSIGHMIELDDERYEVVSICWQNLGYCPSINLYVRKRDKPH